MSKQETIKELKEKIHTLLPEKARVPEALPLPVKYDGHKYFFSENGGMVADCNMDEFFRIRGWGRIQHMQVEGKTPEQLQDECAKYIEEAINSYANITLTDCIHAVMIFTGFMNPDATELAMLVGNWDVGNDNLEVQTPVCLRILAELLGKK